MTTLYLESETVAEAFSPGDIIHAIKAIESDDGRLVLDQEQMALVISTIPNEHRTVIYAAVEPPHVLFDDQWRQLALQPGAESGLRMIRLTWPCTIAKYPMLAENVNVWYRIALDRESNYRYACLNGECPGGCAREKLQGDFCRDTGKHCPRLSAVPAVRFMGRFLAWVNDFISSE